MTRRADPPPLHPWLSPLRAAFAHHTDAANASIMAAYMKHVAPFFGIKAPLRRALVKEHKHLYGPPPLDELPAIVRSAFACPEREMHHTAVDLLVAHARRLGPEHLPFLEELITTKSWWDTVDALAVNGVGVVLRRHPREIARWNKRWIRSADKWLVRTAILFQNRWKDDTDRALLFANIERQAGHPDFFVRKAIGWALRQLAFTDPEAVRTFVRTHALAPLSVHEAMKHL